MGWLYTYGASKRDVIKERCAPWKWNAASGQTIAKCIRGNVLWRVVEVYHRTTGHFERAIMCDLLQTDLEGNWGYKDMDESMHPYYWSCPVKYLGMNTVPYCPEWREGVREYASKVKLRRQRINQYRKQLTRAY